MPINPLDNQFAQLIADMNKRLSNLETNNQPYIGDWNNLGAEPSSVTSTNVITFTNPNYVASNFFQIGDKFRYKQGGSFKYAYVILVNLSNITIDGGLDYIAIIGSISDIGFSRTVNPSGHPLFFHYSAVLSSESAGLTIVHDDFVPANGIYSMSGNSMKITGQAGGILGGTTGSVLAMTLPFDLRVDSVFDSNCLVYGGDQFDTGINKLVAIVYIGTNNPSLSKGYIFKIDNSNYVYPSTTGQAYISFNIDYTY
jgi:hypothetical protein